MQRAHLEGAHVKVGGQYPMDDGHIVIDSIAAIEMADITDDLARESGFDSANDLLETASRDCYPCSRPPAFFS